MTNIWKEMMKVVISKEKSLEKCLQTYVDPIEDDEEFTEMENALVELWFETKGFTKDDFATVDARGLGDRWYCEKYRESIYEEYVFLYDFEPPYIRGGAVIDKAPNKKVLVAGEHQTYYTPLAIFPYTLGIEAQQRLNIAWESCQEQQRMAEEELKAVVQEITNGKRWK